MCSAVMVGDTGIQAPRPIPATGRSSANTVTAPAGDTSNAKTEKSSTVLAIVVFRVRKAS